MRFYKDFIPRKKMLLLLFGSGLGIIIIAAITFCVFLIILLHQFVPLIPKLPNILGFDRTKNYLLLFQNNMELRPGGGFIGAYADITITKGKLGQLHVHNTYDADGQLRQHVEPYYIGRRYLQVHLYMRDSNFDVDFAKSAQKVADMYQLETGHHADGVIAIDFSFVRNIVAILSPIYVWQYNQSVNYNNLFYLTELHADKYSFYGSTQKQDFLKGLYDGMQVRFETHKLQYVWQVFQTVLTAISQKHVLFTSSDSSIQTILTTNHLSSTLYDPRPTIPGTVNDFLGINEANISINKSNYYVKRTISHHVAIGNSGKINETLEITYTNTTQYEHWPTGRYKPYVRVILPHNAKISSISFDGINQHIIPAVTDYRVYEAPGFTPPNGLEVDRSEEEGKTIYGFIVLVDYHTTIHVQVNYSLEQTIPLNSKSKMYNLIVFKQPGMESDPLQLYLTFPSSFKNVQPQFPILEKTNIRLITKTTLATDKNFIVTWQ